MPKFKGSTKIAKTILVNYKNRSNLKEDRKMKPILIKIN
jgi:hypothetical protein